ncbi:Fc receptor-like protein 2 [Cetorhinus maximus]
MDVGSDTGGSYTCKPRYEWTLPYKRLTSNPVEVVTIAPDMKVSLEIKPRAALTGEGINMVCSSHDLEKEGTVFWHRNGEVIRWSHRLYQYIYNARTADEASYRCGFRVGYRMWLSPTVNVTVTERFAEPRLSTESQIFEGEPLRLECFAETKRPGISLQYSFYRDGERLPDNPYGGNEFSRVASLGDSGGYLCEAEAWPYSLRKKSQTVYIWVKGYCEASGDSMRGAFGIHRDHGRYSYAKGRDEQRKFCSNIGDHVRSLSEAFSEPTLSADGQIFEGQPLKVKCRVESNAPWFSLRYRFFKDAHALGSQSFENYYKREAAWLEDSGTYHCQVSATDVDVTKSSDKIYLQINRVPVTKPRLTILPGTDLMEGDAARLRCSVSEGSLPITYRFYKDSGEEVYRETSNLTSAVHEIAGVRPNSGGSYHCEVENGVTENPPQSEFVALAVIVPVTDALLISKPNTTVISVGQRLVLQCRLKAGTAPQFLWYRDNQPLGNTSQSYHFSADGTEFIIHPFQESDGGQYHCVATNKGIKDDIFNATSNSIQVKVPAKSYATTVTASVLPLLLLAAAIALICFKLRGPKQEGTEAVADQLYSVVTREKPNKAEGTEAVVDLVYSVVTIEKPTKAGFQPPRYFALIHFRRLPTELTLYTRRK